MASRYYLYFLSDGPNSVSRVGLTRDIAHAGSDEDRLVYYESHTSEDSAKAREQRIRRWSQMRKAALVSTLNPSWKPLVPSQP